MNYRTTEQIRNQAVAVLKDREIDDLDGGVDKMSDSFSLRHGPLPIVKNFKSEAEESQFIVEQIRRWLIDVAPESICLAVRTNHQLVDRYQPILEGAGIDSVQVHRDPEMEATQSGVRVATMHRLKGLEFSCVIIAGVQDGLVPFRTRAESADDESSRQYDLQERCLFYVAATRARDELVVTGFGTPSSFFS